MKQTRRASLIESVLNTTLGFGVGLAAQIITFPLFGVNLPLVSNMAIAGVFTCVSIARGYVLRRLFESLRVRGVLP